MSNIDRLNKKMCKFITLRIKGKAGMFYGYHYKSYCFTKKSIRDLEGDIESDEMNNTGLYVYCPPGSLLCKMNMNSETMYVVKLPGTDIYIDQYSIEKLLLLQEGKSEVEIVPETMEIFSREGSFMSEVVTKINIIRGIRDKNERRNSIKKYRSRTRTEGSDRQRRSKKRISRIRNIGGVSMISQDDE